MTIITDPITIENNRETLDASLTAYLPLLAMRQVDVLNANDPIQVNYNPEINKWFWHQNNLSSDKFTFFVGDWTPGPGRLPCRGSISFSREGGISHAGIFAEENDGVYILHSGRRGQSTIQEFFNAYTRVRHNALVNGRNKVYAEVGKMNDPNIAQKVVTFFDFLP